MQLAEDTVQQSPSNIIDDNNPTMIKRYRNTKVWKHSTQSHDTDLLESTDATTKNLFPQIDPQFHGGINT